MRRPTAPIKECIILMRRREEGEEAEARGERERRKGGEKPGQALGSSNPLFLGPTVKRQAEGGWASATLIILLLTAISNPFLAPVDSTTASYLVLLPLVPSSPPAGHQQSFY